MFLEIICIRCVLLYPCGHERVLNKWNQFIGWVSLVFYASMIILNYYVGLRNSFNICWCFSVIFYDFFNDVQRKWFVVRRRHIQRLTWCNYLVKSPVYSNLWLLFWYHYWWFKNKCKIKKFLWRGLFCFIKNNWSHFTSLWYDSAWIWAHKLPVIGQTLRH